MTWIGTPPLRWSITSMELPPLGSLSNCMPQNSSSKCEHNQRTSQAHTMCQHNHKLPLSCTQLSCILNIHLHHKPLLPIPQRVSWLPLLMLPQHWQHKLLHRQC